MPILPLDDEIIPVTEKKPAFYRLSSQVSLPPKLGSYDLKFGFVQN